MRLFIAINIPEEIQTYLREIQAQLPAAKMRKTGDFHVTLKFLGRVGSAKVLEIKKVLDNIVVEARHAWPLHWQCALDSKISFFKDRCGFIKVIWVGLKIPSAVFELQKKMEQELKPLGFEVENRFKPHLTLARVKYYEDISGRKGGVPTTTSCRGAINRASTFEQQLALIKVEPRKFEINGFALMESFLSPEGAQYREVQKWS